MQHVRTALNHGDFDAEPDEELRELDRHSAAAKNNERLGQAFQLQRRVAIEAIEIIQLRQRGRSDAILETPRWLTGHCGGDMVRT